MKDYIDNPQIYKLIAEHSGREGANLMMRYSSKMAAEELRFCAMQIDARRKTAGKLSEFLAHSQFIFPTMLSAEQATDQRVASYRAKVIGGGHNILDMTAGLGIDSMTLVMHGNRVTAIELDEIKCTVLSHNAITMGISNFKVVNADSVEFIKGMDCANDDFDLIYIDPARRDNADRKVFLLSDCLPDITQFYKQLLDSGHKLVIKLSPMLDITAILRQLENVSCVHAVSVKGECKELMLELEPGAHNTQLIAVDLDDSGVKSSFQVDAVESGKSPVIDYDSDIQTPGCYLYEPNASVMKLNSFGALCARYQGLKMSAPNTHLFVANELFIDFPGRISRIENVPDKKEIKALSGGCYNVVARNYPLKADELRKRLKLKEGSDKFIYAFRHGQGNKPTIVVTSRIKAEP